MPQLESSYATATWSEWVQDYGFVRALEERGWRILEGSARYVAEFLGSFLLTFTAACAYMGEEPPRAPSVTLAPTSNACILMVAVYALGPVSGAHFNPAISLATGLANKGNWRTLVYYTVCQFVGGFAGGLAACWEFKSRPERALGPGDGFTMSDCMTVELVFTAILCFVFLNVASSRGNNPPREGNHFYGLAIGFVAVAGGYAGSGISGAYFNPAVTVGLAIADSTQGSGTLLSYQIFQAFGAIIAALLFLIVRPAEGLEESEFRARKYTLHERCLCEGLGSLATTFTMGLAQLSGREDARPWAMGATVMCMTYAVQDISGAHFNPAVTLAVHLSGKRKGGIRDALGYIMAQTGFGIIGALLYTAVFNGHNNSLIEGRVAGYGGKYELWQVGVLEFVFTAMLAYTVLSVSTVKGISSPLRRNYYYGLAIGMCVAAGGFAAGPVSGGIMNPAFSIATSFAHLVNHGDFWPCLVYSLVQLSGGLVAVVIFHVTQHHGTDLERTPLNRKGSLDVHTPTSERTPKSASSRPGRGHAGRHSGGVRGSGLEPKPESESAAVV